MEKGKIYVIEGTDGSGKQTQTKRLVEYLRSQGKTVLTQSFPNYDSASSGPVKMYLGGEFGDNTNCINAYQSSVLFAVDRFCTLKTLEKQINDGVYIVFDRYVSSNMLHQACKIENQEERIKFLNWLDDFEHNLMQLIRPDQIFFLDVPPKKSIELAHARAELKAGTKKDIHESDESYLFKSYDAGKQVCEMYGWTIIDCIDENNNLKSIEQISNEIISKLNI